MAKPNVTKFKPNKKGIAKLRSGPKVLAELERRAKLVQAAATRTAEAAGYELEHNGSPGMEIDVNKPKGPKARGRVSVRTTTRAAIEAEATDRVLTKAFQAAKG